MEDGETTCDGFCFCPSAVKPSKPQCWMEGKPLEGSDVKMSCKSADGSDPIHYKWERVLDKGKYVGKLPPLAMIGKLAHTLYICPLRRFSDQQH